MTNNSERAGRTQEAVAAFAEQRERRRLAQVLHDHLQQLLVGAKFGLELLDRKVRGDRRDSIHEVQGLLDEAIERANRYDEEILAWDSAFGDLTSELRRRRSDRPAHRRRRWRSGTRASWSRSPRPSA